MSDTIYTFHPAANLFPIMGEAELVALAGDIAAQGLKESITLFEGQILDGRNRYLACEQAGMEPRFEEWTGDSPTAWVLSKNLYRRHLTASQKATIAVEALPLFEVEAKARQRAAAATTNEKLGRGVDETVLPFISEPSPGRSVDKAGAAVGVSPAYITEAKSLKENEPDLFEQVKAGEVTLTAARKLREKKAPKKIYPVERLRFTSDEAPTPREGDEPTTAEPMNPVKLDLTPSEEVLLRFQDRLVTELFQRHPQLTIAEWSAISERLRRRLEATLRSYRVTRREFNDGSDDSIEREWGAVAAVNPAGTAHENGYHRTPERPVYAGGAGMDDAEPRGGNAGKV